MLQSLLVSGLISKLAMRFCVLNMTFFSYFSLGAEHLPVVVGQLDERLATKQIQKRVALRRCGFFVIAFYSPNSLTTIQQRNLSVFESSCHLSATHGRGFTLSINCWTSNRKAANTNFSGLWLEPSRNQTRVYRFRSRFSVHSTTDHFNL